MVKVARRKGETVEHGEYAAMMRRMIRGYGRRLEHGDVEDLAELVAMRDELDAAIADAVARQRATYGRSWADIAVATGTTRQGAQQRYGRRAVVAEDVLPGTSYSVEPTVPAEVIVAAARRAYFGAAQVAATAPNAPIRPSAKPIRAALRAAGVDHFVVRVLAHGHREVLVLLRSAVHAPSTDRSEDVAKVAAAIRPLWTDGDVRVREGLDAVSVSIADYQLASPQTA